MGEAEAIAAAPASPRKPSGMFSYLLLIVFLVVIVYPLSFGPVAWFYVNHPSAPGSSTVILLYSPLGVISDHNKTAHDFFVAYAKLWGIPR